MKTDNGMIFTFDFKISKRKYDRLLSLMLKAIRENEKIDREKAKHSPYEKHLRAYRKSLKKSIL